LTININISCQVISLSSLVSKVLIKLENLSEKNRKERKKQDIDNRNKQETKYSSMDGTKHFLQNETSPLPCKKLTSKEFK
jgi:hypothetical protein